MYTANREFGAKSRQSETRQEEKYGAIRRLSETRQEESKKKGCTDSTKTNKRPQEFKVRYQRNTNDSKDVMEISSGLSETGEEEQTETMGCIVSHSEPTEEIMRGLENRSLECYANSILQVLAQTPDFLHRLEEYPSQKENGPLAIAPLITILKYINGEGKEYLHEMDFLMDCICSFSSVSFRPNRQEDCHSFLMDLLTLLQNEQGDSKNNIISLFEGEFTYNFRCDGCESRETKKQLFRSIQVPLVQERDSEESIRDLSNHTCKNQNETVTIQKGLDHRMKTEKFENNELPCEKCKDISKTTTKEVGISRYPLILVLQLERIQFRRGVLYKENVMVQYPEELLMSKYASVKGPSLDGMYNLYGVVRHFGTRKGGHYSSLVRHRETKKWYHCDDSNVNEIKRAKRLTNKLLNQGFIVERSSLRKFNRRYDELLNNMWFPFLGCLMIFWSMTIINDDLMLFR